MYVAGLLDWMLGLGLGFMNVVARCDAATLLPTVQAHVAPGTIIHSDEWAAYNRVASLPNVASHSIVNHSVTFVDRYQHSHVLRMLNLTQVATFRLSCSPAPDPELLG